ncbi:hypothetical protein WMY93_003891 [Mugilogobius chulae]|uniref:Protein Wnt n=1 Tax=Mugilogobius chulae TaxID=88201 RepID=A0AAW0Q687_9GOBI
MGSRLPRTACLLRLIALCILLTHTAAYFGLTGREPLVFLPGPISNDAPNGKAHLKQCEQMTLTRRQKRLCRREPGLAETLRESVRLSLLECRYQFRNERWNCSLDGRGSLLKRGGEEWSENNMQVPRRLRFLAVRTCWKQLSPFHDTGRLLKYKYDNSVKVLSVTNAATGETELAGPRRHRQNLRTTDLVYLEDSPSFCRASRYSGGTGGRTCAKDTTCQSLCCGRGYNTAMRLTSLSCHCQVRWCCHVECQTCVREEEVYTCKNA